MMAQIKWWKYLMWLSLVFALAGCKGELPIPMDEEPVFIVEMDLDGQFRQIEAGVEGWFMDAKMALSDDEQRTFSGSFQNFDTSRKESFTILFRDWKQASLNDPLDDQAFGLGAIPFFGQIDPNGENRSFQFRALTQGKAPYEYSWDFGDGNSSTEAEPLHTFASDGKFKVNLSIKDGRGCWSFARQEVRVGSEFRECRVGINYEFITDGEVNLSAELEEELVAPTSVIWSLGDGNKAENQNSLSHTYEDPNIFEVQLAAHFDDKTCIVFENIYPYARQSCLSNMEYSPANAGQGFGRVVMTYQSPDGKTFSSMPFKGQPSESECWLEEVEEFEDNQRGRPTKKLKVRFDARLYNIEDETEVIEVGNGKAVIAVEVP